MPGLKPGDAELIAAVRSGDLDAYGLLYRRHARSAAALARQLAGSRAEADDLVAEAFAKVLDVLRTGRGPDTAFRAYLLTTVRHTRYDRTRRDRRLELSDDMTRHDPGVPWHDTAVAGLESALAARAFARLPERWQTVLWHTEVEQETPAQIAPLLGLTPNGVAALAYRAREGLRQAYLQEHLATAVTRDHRTTIERLGAWARGGLSTRAQARVDAHLATCPDCRALATELEDVNAGLRSVIAPLVLGAGAAAYLAGNGGTAGTAAAGTAAASQAAGTGGVAGAAGGGAGAAGGGAGAAGGPAAGGTAGSAAAGSAAAGNATAGSAGVGSAATGSAAAGSEAAGSATAGSAAGSAAAGSTAAGSATAGSATGSPAAGSTAAGSAAGSAAGAGSAAAGNAAAGSAAAGGAAASGAALAGGEAAVAAGTAAGGAGSALGTVTAWVAGTHAGQAAAAAVAALVIGGTTVVATHDGGASAGTTPAIAATSTASAPGLPGPNEGGGSPTSRGAGPSATGSGAPDPTGSPGGTAAPRATATGAPASGANGGAPVPTGRPTGVPGPPAGAPVPPAGAGKPVLSVGAPYAPGGLRRSTPGTVAVPVSNSGDGGVTDLVATVRLPAGVTARSGSGSDDWDCAGDGRVATCSRDELGEGESTVLLVPVDVDPDAVTAAVNGTVRAATGAVVPIPAAMVAVLP